jgi:mandelate racemase
MVTALDAAAADFVMPDADRIGGVTGWQLAARIAAERNVPMSSHLFPEVSAHLLAATPTCHFLEYVDWANAILQQPLTIERGCALLTQRPGCGMVWDDAAVKHYRLN